MPVDYRTAMEQDRLARRPKPAATDPTSPAQPETVTSITNRFMGTPQPVAPAPAPAAPVFNAQAAGDAARARIAQNNAAMNAQRDFKRAYDAGANAQELQVLHGYMDDLRSSSPAAQARTSDLRDQYRMAGEGSVRTTASGYGATTATNNARAAEAERIKAQAVADQGLIPASTGLRQAQIGRDTQQATADASLIAPKTAAESEAYRLKEAQSSRAYQSVGLAGDTADAEMRTKIASQPTLDEIRAAHADEDRMRKAQADLAALNVQAQSQGVLSPEQAARRREAMVTLDEQRAKYAGQAIGVQGLQAQAEAEQARGQAAMATRQAASALTGISPNSILEQATPIIQSIGQRINASVGDVFGFNRGRVSPRLSGTDIADEIVKLDSLDRMISDLEEYGKSDPVNAKRAANMMLDQLPATTASGQYEPSSAWANGPVGRTEPFRVYANKLTGIRQKLARLAALK